MSIFEKVYKDWLDKQIDEEKNARRREFLSGGLGHGTVEFLRKIWFPVIQNLDHLYAEYEVRDLNNKTRYLDLAFLPGEQKGCIEVHGFASHARDIEASRFKDLCMKQAMLVLGDWHFLPIAYLSIRDDPEQCKQLILAFVGKFLSTHVSVELDWLESESLRFARRTIRAFTPKELAVHLKITEQHTRIVLRKLVSKQMLVVASGKQRYRSYQLPQ